MRRNSLLGQPGQGISEYALILVLMGLAVILILSVTGTDVASAYCKAVSSMGWNGLCGSYFVDSFNNLGNWLTASGNWRIENGELAGGVGEGRLFHEMSQSDYTLTVNGATLKQGNGYGVFFRSTNPTQVNGYSFQYDPGYGGGAFIMRKWVNGNELPPFAVASAPNYNWYNNPRQVQIQVKGNTYSAYMDGKLVVQGSDSTYTQGGVGFRTWDNTQARFDSVAVDPVK